MKLAGIAFDASLLGSSSVVVVAIARAPRGE